MDEQVSRLVSKVQAKLDDLPPDRRLLIGIAGIPGAGKSTIASLVTSRLNALSPDTAIDIPMDGFHLTRAALSALPDPQNAHARRGAAFTFDPEAFHSLVASLREPIISTSTSTSTFPTENVEGRADMTIYAPSFDHAIKDPKQDDIAIRPSHRIVIIEGNYVALNHPAWSPTASLFDELWFVEVPFDVARRRLIERHVRAGIAADEDEGRRRADENDLVNGKEIVENMVPVNEVLRSLSDEDQI